MNQIVAVKMGDARVAHNPAVLETSGIGSCVAIMLYDPKTHIGGLAHAMLPQSEGKSTSSGTELRYVDLAIGRMLADMMKDGCSKPDIVAKIVGGAHMFSLYSSSIGDHNVREAKYILQHEGIPIAAEETGGTVGRTVRFDLSTGVCSVETKM